VHRKKTKFAARVHRVATAVERRGVVATYELHDRLGANRTSRRLFASAPPVLDATQQRVIQQLRKDGYATLPVTELVDEQDWAELEANAARFITETEAGLAGETEGGSSELRRRPGKEFVVRKYAYGVKLALDDPWLRLGTNRRLLDIANAYLEMWTKLEYVDLWYTPPAGGEDERRSSQRWHRDFNDRHLLKAFIYLVDVDADAGPFEYVPQSAPGAELDGLWPWRPLGENYPPEDELMARVDDRAVTFTAPKGTIIFCNTSGFHRGGYAKKKPRALATFTWDSPASLKALSERNYLLEQNGRALDGPAEYALT
jgi:Phytanoyl-CoA dioxygenase (PhyH)